MTACRLCVLSHRASPTDADHGHNLMAILDPGLSEMQRALKDALSTHWRLFMFQGAIMIVLGVLAVAIPITATVVVDSYLGWLFLLSGVVGLIAIFSAKDIPAFLWSLVTAPLSVTIGALLIAKPVKAVLSVTFVLAAFFIAEGIFQIVTSRGYRDIIGRSSGWMLVSGLSDLALAVIIIFDWSPTSAWVLGLLVGINLITTGWAILMVALAGRNFSRAPSPVP
jgi:uncharacterized membrane protein HdeD (DUF308 family)